MVTLLSLSLCLKSVAFYGILNFAAVITRECHAVIWCLAWRMFSTPREPVLYGYRETLESGDFAKWNSLFYFCSTIILCEVLCDFTGS